MTILARWDWDAASGPQRLMAEVAQAGLAWMRMGDVGEEARAAPWSFAERLLGTRPLLLERQPIHAVPGGRSYASGTMPAPFHTDSQCALEVPAALQVMVCVRPAEDGGACLYLDGWDLLRRIERDDAGLYPLLFTEVRTQPFFFGPVGGPTVSLRDGHLVITHSAVAADSIARRLRPHVEAAPVIELRPEAGDVVVASNHRLLHGRRAFSDTRRAFVRLLAWPREPLPAPPAWRERAAQAWPAGPEGWPADDAGRRLEAVLELLRATPAGILSARHGVPEEVLYRWRDEALRAMAQALTQR